MRCAVILYGEFRECEIAKKSWDFLDKIDHDIFISTFDYSFQENTKLGIKRERFIDQKLIEDLFPNANISILKESDYFNDYCINHESKNRTLRVVLHWKNGVRMITEKNIKYDFLILLRTDTYVKYEISEDQIEEIVKNKHGIYCLDYLDFRSHRLFLMDLFYIGNFEVIMDLINTIPDDLRDFHNQFVGIIIDKKYTVFKIKDQINVSVIRPNCLYLNIDNMDHFAVAKKHIEWDENR